MSAFAKTKMDSPRQRTRFLNFFVCLLSYGSFSVHGLPEEPSVSTYCAYGYCVPITVGGSTPTSPSTTPPTSSSSPATSPTTMANQRNNPIKKGYVAFGDSFAAGFGTGYTEQDPCRKGEFAHPQLLEWDAEENASTEIDFQRRYCSGAVITEIMQGSGTSQVDLWNVTNLADIATISVGGNDLGFSQILTECILWVNPFRSHDCDKEIKRAKDVLAGPDLRRNILTTLAQILKKSGRHDFKIYFTGYPAFFNVDTDYCEDVTFYFWRPHRGKKGNTGGPWLTKSLRKQLNDFVQDLNRFIENLVNEFNEQPEHKDNHQVVYVHTDPAFDGHRFCEDGVNEPDPGRVDTWFFLSAWQDYSFATNSQRSANGHLISVTEKVTAGNTSALPDPSCTVDVSDLASAVACSFAKQVAVPGSNESMINLRDQQAIARGDFDAVEVPWWIWTRWGKAFHPRTLGQLAYKNTLYEYF